MVLRGSLLMAAEVYEVMRHEFNEGEARSNAKLQSRYSTKFHIVQLSCCVCVIGKRHVSGSHISVMVTVLLQQVDLESTAMLVH